MQAFHAISTVLICNCVQYKLVSEIGMILNAFRL